MLTLIPDYVNHWASRAPGREAAVDSARRLTYAELQREVDTWAAALLRAGVTRGDRVMCLSQPGVDTWVCFLATASIGAVWVGLTARYTAAETRALVRDSEPALMLDLLEAGGHPDDLPWRSRNDVFASETDPQTLRLGRCGVISGDAAAMIYTSGTTGAPKGALVPHRALVYCGQVQSSHWYPNPPRKLCDLPMNHIGGLGDISTSTLVAGGTVVFRPYFDAEAAVRLIEGERITHLYYIPTQLLAMVETQAWSTNDLTSLEWIIWGGAAAPYDLLVELKRTGAQLATSYSLTESVGSVTFTDPEDSLETLSWSIGRVDPRYQVRITRHDGSTADLGEPGEIWIRGDHITLGYHNDPAKTAEKIDPDGWLHTGDVAIMEPDGSLRLVGRRSEMYKSGGFNVYPREVELALEEHPCVELAVVIGIPDKRWGEVGHAFLITDGEDTEEGLRAFLKQRLANYKVPKRFWVESSLPMLGVGKVNRTSLRRTAIERSSSR